MADANAKQDLQNHSTILHPYIIAAGVLLGVLALFPSLIAPAGFALIVGVFVWNMAERQRKERERIARLTAVANICGPIVVASIWATEDVTSVAERAQTIRQDLKDSGNKYAHIIPVIEYPFSPMMYETGQLTLAWSIYQRMAAEKQHQANLEWVNGKCPDQIKALFMSQVMPAPKPEAV